MTKEQRKHLRRLADAATKYFNDNPQKNAGVNGHFNSLLFSSESIPALLDQIDQLERQNQDLVECNNRYLQRAREAEEALRFYADERRYTETFRTLSCECCSEHVEAEIITDNGERARKALGEKHD